MRSSMQIVLKKMDFDLLLLNIIYSVLCEVIGVIFIMFIPEGEVFLLLYVKHVLCHYWVLSFRHSARSVIFCCRDYHTKANETILCANTRH